ncbi:hypothetical protein [Chryseobacterium sp. JV558]|uniref:hypothetical protein n=1 Tax=Chryseobacterium sp. JV558 TaxID=2663236 RepID=UPI00299E380B|nr:hypothetical protein [Chryseobacterium sp. JV558]MDW9378743.1 hypothetical protein [Chryseobacterium sp. JV558]
MGVNTASPKSTLDITAKNATGTSTNADGILIPRVDRQRALSMTSVEPSTLIYINNISTGTATGQASNIDAVGFYHFDVSTSKWTKLNTDTNIYNANGTLTGNRVMSMANNSLILRNGNEANLYIERSGTGNLQSSQNVANLYASGYVGDTNTILSGIRTYYRGNGSNNNSSMTFSVNGASNNNLVLANNNNVGIGTDSPTQKLHVNGSIRIVDGSQGASKVLTSDANGVSTWADLPDTTANNGLTKTGSNLQLGGTLVKNTNIAMAGFNATFSGTGNVGIGTSTPVPGSKVNIQGGPLNIGNTVQYAGGLQVRNLDSTKPILLAFNTVSNERFRIEESGNVGVGTNAPTQKLDVDGNVRLRNVPLSTTMSTSDNLLAIGTDGVVKKTKVSDNYPPAVFGTLTSSDITIEPNKYMGAWIGLTKGKWIVYIGQLVDTVNSESVINLNNNRWVRFTLSSSNTSLQTTGFSFLGTNLISGWLTPVVGQFQYTYFTGSIPVNVTSDSIYLHVFTRNLNSVGNPPAVKTGSYGENFLYAIPVAN